MPDAQPTCPSCGKTDKVAKVSAIYLEGIRQSQRQKRSLAQAHSQESLLLPAERLGMSPAHLKLLSQRLKPPESGRTQVIRPIHPDLAIILFSFIVPFFLSEIYANQPNVFLPILVLLAAFYSVYFLLRRKLSTGFAAQQMKRKEAETAVQRAIQHWMQLWYCPCDDIAFVPGTEAAIPVDQLAYHLSQIK